MTGGMPYVRLEIRAWAKYLPYVYYIGDIRGLLLNICRMSQIQTETHAWGGGGQWSAQIKRAQNC